MGIFDISTQEKRERFLLIVAGVVLLCVVVPFCYSYFSSSISQLRTQKAKLKDEIAKLDAEIKDEKHVREQLTEFSKQSLPPGEHAKSQYQNWIVDTAGSVGLRERKVDIGSETTLKDYYKKYTFKLTCKGTLEQIAEFLRRFHKTDYLHLIRKITPAVNKSSNLMDVTITIEAMSLTKAQTSRMLRVPDKDMLKITPQEQSILDEIKSRKLFTAYSPPKPPPPIIQPPPPPPKPQPFYQAPYCYVIAIVESNGQRQVWIDNRAIGQQHKLYEGGSFKLEGVDCIIEKIEFDCIHVEADKQKFVIKQGKSFAEYE
jgi:Tfp pilus assembly protein PilO